MSLSHTYEGWRELDPLGRPGPALRAQAILLVAVYLLQAPLGLEAWGVLRPEEALLQGRLWQLLSYALLHQNFLHLLFNLLGLWVFGTELERLWGARSYWLYSLVCAVGAGLSHAVLDTWRTGQASGVMGASGVVYGLIAAYGLLFRQRRLLFLGLIPVRAGVLALVFAGLALFSGVVQSQDGVAHFAHLGGMLSGLALLYFGPARRAWRLWWHRRRMLRHLRRAGTRPAAPDSDPFRLTDASDEDQIERRLDDLLGKVSRQGLGSLEPRERAFLDEASRWLKARKALRP
jgi:membrane associated rhomboid family serine protease